MWTPDQSIIITLKERSKAAFISERDSRLLETDWVVLRAFEQGVSVPQEWLDYRQYLRDMPQINEDLTKPVWPSKPQN